MEQRLRHVARQAPAPTVAWLESLESQARGARRRPRRRGAVFAAGLIAVALAGAVLAVALRRPEGAPTPRNTSPTVPTQASTIETRAASPLVATIRVTGVASPLRKNLVHPNLAAQIVPGSVRTIAETGNGQVAQVFILPNGAACLAAYGDVDCALPADNRRMLALRGNPLAGELTAPLLVVVTPDVRSVTIHQKDGTFSVHLKDGVGLMQAPDNHLDYDLTLDNGTVFRVGLPWDVAAKAPPAPGPSGAGRAFPRDILRTAGQPAVLPAGIVPPVLQSLHVPSLTPDAGSARLLATDLGVEHATVYAWTSGKHVCLATAGISCGLPIKLHMLWLAGGGTPYPDYVVGIVASSVRRAWLQLPDGSRIDATIDKQVVSATIPLDRTVPGETIHLHAQLNDGTVIDERPELLG
jgi:hypothetical protein